VLAAPTTDARDSRHRSVHLRAGAATKNTLRADDE
jgi:hypothetical protein